ncbi:MAG: thioredoxin [Prevotella sp.]|uniref:thioredoxin n=1 Tax=Prevotella sp. AGR2160 TaxID=1280674 RepID=UPI0003F6BDF6|nr:thioredoxin [Prevotella sp. AGR2160]MDD5862080.1 thioredoxin [Prevotella sp.]
MRKCFLTLAVIAMSLAACSQTGQGAHSASPKEQTKEQVKNNKPKGEKAMVTEMTTEMFKEKIMDYTANPKEWVYKGDRPAVIDFYATWCGPCKATAPVVAELADELAGKVDFYKVDVDQQEELAAVFGIRSIPSLLFIPKDGKPQMQVGAMDKQMLTEAVNKVLLK